MIKGWTDSTQLPKEVEDILRHAKDHAQAAVETIQRAIASQNLDTWQLEVAHGHMVMAAASTEAARNLAEKYEEQLSNV
jgi:hypothetical protein